MATAFDVVSALRGVMALFNVPVHIRKMVRATKRQPTREEAEILVAYARRLNERRVFFAPFNVEVVECCIGSLEEVRRFTDEALSKLKHPYARATVAAILEDVRHFLDRWRAFRTPRDPWRHRMHGDGEEAELAEFFKDLGELRIKVRMWCEMLVQIEPALGDLGLSPATTVTSAKLPRGAKK
jgi:hypothetical protein